MPKPQYDPAKFDPTINEADLTAEWCRQPLMYATAARKLADANRVVEEATRELDLQREEAKYALDLCRAEVELAIRKAPDKYGLPKVTEDIVKAAVQVQPEYQIAVKAMIAAKNGRAADALIEAQHNVGILKAAVVALDHKKKALESLVQLQIRDYHAEPRMPADARPAMEENIKREARELTQKQINDTARLPDWSPRIPSKLPDLDEDGWEE